MSFQLISTNHFADHHILTDRHFGRLLVRDLTTWKRDGLALQKLLIPKKHVLYIKHRIIHVINEREGTTKSDVFNLNPVFYKNSN